MLRARPHLRRVLGFACLVAGGAAPAARAADAPPPPLLRLARTIPLPGVEGRLDHMTVDGEGQRLAIAALGNDSVEVIDLAKGEVRRRLAPLPEPQGVLFLPDGRLVVACGRDGSVRSYGGPDLGPAGRIDLGDDADNVRFDPGTGRVYVGYGEGALGVLEGDRRAGDVRLSAHPEAFSLESSGGRLFVNVPGAGHVAVVDRAKGAVVATWPVREARANFPMALDDTGHRLFVGCRAPARLVVLDTASGKTVATLEISGDVDDIAYDEKGRRLYLSCGEGFVDVVAQGDGDRYERVARVATAKGARTSLLLPASGVLYVAVPRTGDRPAEIRAYEVVR